MMVTPNRTQVARVMASPEEIFLTWILNLSDGVDASEAAVGEIARLDRLRPYSPHLRRLRELFVAAAVCPAPKGRLS
jgi:hypothetical protein